MERLNHIKLIYGPMVETQWASWPDKSCIAEDVDQIPEIAGRECYQSFNNKRPGGNKAYLKRILSEGHGSVLEHATVGFRISGVSRSLTHELIRHRAGTAVSELSQRYVDMSEIGFVVPPYLIEYPSQVDQLVNAFDMALSTYKGIVDTLESGSDNETTLARKRIREAARAVLPAATETRIVFTANLRAWRNILEQRGNIHADLEIRRLALMLCVQLKQIAPNVFQDFEAFVDEDGRLSLKSEYRKV